MSARRKTSLVFVIIAVAAIGVASPALEIFCLRNTVDGTYVIKSTVERN
jgi:hypothetical protein